MASTYCLRFQVQITTLEQSIHIEDCRGILQFSLVKYETQLS